MPFHPYAVIESTAAAVTMVTAIAAVVWRPAMARHDTRVANELFLNGVKARPGFVAVSPAGARLAAVEARLESVTEKLDANSVVLDRLAAEIATVVAEVHPNGGGSLRDKVDQIAGEQSRVAQNLTSSVLPVVVVPPPEH